MIMTVADTNKAIQLYFLQDIQKDFGLYSMISEILMLYKTVCMLGDTF